MKVENQEYNGILSNMPIVNMCLVLDEIRIKLNTRSPPLLKKVKQYRNDGIMTRL